MFKFFFNAFRRAKGERVTAEYVVIDEDRLLRVEQKYVVKPEKIVIADQEMLEDYKEVTRLCKTYVSDPVVFELCRQIEDRIAEILEARFVLQGEDMWLFEDKSLPLRNEKVDDEEEP